MSLVCSTKRTVPLVRSVVQEFCQFLVLRSGPQKGPLGGIRRTTATEIKSALRAAGVAFAIALAAPAAARERGETVALNLERVISNIPGKSLIAVVVDYAPGGASRPHTHAKSAFIFAYVVSGTIESQVNDQPKRFYHAGESWYETPGSSHRVSRNASATEHAKLLAVFVVDTEDKTLTTPAP